MKFAFLKAPFQVQIRDEAVGEPGEGEVLLNIKACGVCGSDINSAYTNKEFQHFGHEMAGVVEKIGPGVHNVKVGDRVAVESSSFCGTCPACRNGHPELCENRPSTPSHYSGFAEKIIIKSYGLVPIDGISFEEGSMIEPFGVAMDMVLVTDIQIGNTVVVYGAGPIALMAMRLAKLKGAAKVIALAHSHSKKRVELAKEFGADEVIFTDQVNPVEALKGRQIDRIMVTTPPATVADAVEMASWGCIIGVIGIGREGSECTLDINKMHFKRLQLRFSHATPALFFPQCIDLVRTGMVEIKKLISHTFSLDEMQQAMDVIKNDKENTVKVLMVKGE